MGAGPGGDPGPAGTGAWQGPGPGGDPGLAVDPGPAVPGDGKNGQGFHKNPPNLKLKPVDCWILMEVLAL